MELWEVAAREAIRELVARYAHAADGGRFDELVASFAPDGVLETPDRVEHRGRDAILAFLGGTRTVLASATTAPLIRHHVSNLRLEVTDATAATGAAYFFVVTERGPDHWGRYRDRYVCLEGRSASSRKPPARRSSADSSFGSDSEGCRPGAPSMDRLFRSKLVSPDETATAIVADLDDWIKDVELAQEPRAWLAWPRSAQRRIPQ